jgi:hypothetical protein
MLAQENNQQNKKQLHIKTTQINNMPTFEGT